jgi:pSer/pThr/pTyr-binding forkhead associated (FHA) protein
MAEMRVPRPESGRELKAVLDAARAGRPFLLFRDSGGNQRLHVLDDSAGWLTLGRAAESDVTLSWDEQVSAVHAELHRVGGEWIVLDDGLSSNGTFLNGERVSGRRRLRDNDLLRVGRTLLVYRASSPASAAATVEADGPPLERLTETQRLVVTALCRPYRDGGRFVTPATNQQIGNEVHLGVDAVKSHLRALYGKFGLNQLPQNEKRVRLAECALRWGVVSRNDL